jgi:hypothetical protein
MTKASVTLRILLVVEDFRLFCLNIRWIEKSTTDSIQNPDGNQKGHAKPKTNVDGSRRRDTSILGLVSGLLKCHELARKGQEQEEEGSNKLSSSGDEVILDDITLLLTASHALKWLV